MALGGAIAERPLHRCTGARGLAGPLDGGHAARHLDHDVHLEPNARHDRQYADSLKHLALDNCPPFL